MISSIKCYTCAKKEKLSTKLSLIFIEILVEAVSRIGQGTEKSD